jgi:hypothetical protein
MVRNLGNKGLFCKNVRKCTYFDIFSAANLRLGLEYRYIYHVSFYLGSGPQPVSGEPISPEWVWGTET